MSLSEESEELLGKVRQALESRDREVARSDVLRKRHVERDVVDEFSRRDLASSQERLSVVTAARDAHQRQAELSAQECERLRLALQDAERRVKALESMGSIVRTVTADVRKQSKGDISACSGAVDVMTGVLDRLGISHRKDQGEPDPAAHVSGEDRGRAKPEHACDECCIPERQKAADEDALRRARAHEPGFDIACDHGVANGLWCERCGHSAGLEGFT